MFVWRSLLLSLFLLFAWLLLSPRITESLCGWTDIQPIVLLCKFISYFPSVLVKSSIDLNIPAFLAVFKTLQRTTILATLRRATARLWLALIALSSLTDANRSSTTKSTLTPVTTLRSITKASPNTVSTSRPLFYINLRQLILPLPLLTQFSILNTIRIPTNNFFFDPKQFLSLNYPFSETRKILFFIR